MANKEQLEILLRSVEDWNKWRIENPNNTIIDFSRADLSGANLCGANLIGAELIEADLFETDLIETDLFEGNLQGANLQGANLRGANLINANLSEANLSEANLFFADLQGAILSLTNLSRASLHGVNLSKAVFDKSILGGISLSSCIGLETIQHIGPCTIGTDTLQNSQGKIPIEFLKGCGLSDWEIKSAELYNPDLSNQELNNLQYEIYDLRAHKPLQISPLFISYNHRDSQFVERVEKQLTKLGIRYWRDVHHAPAGRLEKIVDRAIRHNPTVLIIFSKNSIQSDWVEHEVESARELEKEIGRDVLCPVALDNSWKKCNWDKRLMRQVNKYHILDFSEWQDDAAFKKNFKKLIDGLELFYSG